MLKGQDRLDEPGDAGGGLEVPDVRLCRPEQEGPRPRTAAETENRGQRVDLDRVAQRGAGSVRLEVGDLVRLDARIREGAPDQRLLGACRSGR